MGLERQLGEATIRIVAAGWKPQAPLQRYRLAS